MAVRSPGAGSIAPDPSDSGTRPVGDSPRGVDQRDTGAQCRRPCRGARTSRTESINIRLGRGLAGAEELEVAALVRLRRLVHEKLSIPAAEALLRRLPVLAAAGELVVGHAQVDLPRFDIQL